MADASSIRKASSLSSSSDAGSAFYKSAIRFYNNQAHVNTGTQWAPLGNVVLNVPLQTATDATDQNAFIADRAYQVVSVSEVHSVAGTDAGAVTLAVNKCTGTQAASAGANILTSTLNLKNTANTVASGTLSATAANSVLAAGNRIAFDITGTTTGLVGAVVTIVLRPV
jgi:hypothetical protein